MSGKYRIEDHGDAIVRRIEEVLRRRLARCAVLIWTCWKELLSVEGAGVGPGGKLSYGANPSKPGDPPHVQRGRLRASAAWEVVGLVARVGSNLLYALILELGGRQVAARPSLRRAAREKAAQCEAILSAPIEP